MAILSPADIPKTLKGWFDASNTSTLSVSGNNLTVWNDLSGQNDHLDTIQGNNPQSGVRKINGRNAIEFNNDGAIYDLDNTGGVDVPQLTIGFVFVADAGTGTIVSSRTTLDSRVSINSGLNLLMQAGSANSQTSIQTLSTGQTYRTIAVYDGVNSKLWINGSSENMTLIVEDRLLIAMIGANGAGGTDYFDGLVGEVAIYDQALSDTEAQDLDQYFYDKWVKPWYEFVFQSEQFIETGLKTGQNTAMRIYANGTIQVGELNEVASTSSMRLFANAAVQAAEFIEVPPN